MVEELPGDSTLIMEVLFDIRGNTETIIGLPKKKTMAKKKKLTAEEYAEIKARGADLDRRLQEAIARRKAEEAERRRGEPSK